MYFVLFIVTEPSCPVRIKLPCFCSFSFPQMANEQTHLPRRKMCMHCETYSSFNFSLPSVLYGTIKARSIPTLVLAERHSLFPPTFSFYGYFLGVFSILYPSPLLAFQQTQKLRLTNSSLNNNITPPPQPPFFQLFSNPIYKIFPGQTNQFFYHSTPQGDTHLHTFSLFFFI